MESLAGKTGTVTLADGLPPGDHTLTVAGGGVTAVTVYNPQGAAPDRSPTASGGVVLPR